MVNSKTHDALYDAMRAKKLCSTLQWELFKTHLDKDTNMPREIHNHLRTIVYAAENDVPRRGVELDVQAKQAPCPEPDDFVQTQCRYDVHALSNRTSNGARTCDKDKMVSKRKLNEVVKGGHEANKRAAVQVHKWDVYQEPGPSNYNRVTKNQCEHIHQCQPSETAEVERKRKLPGPEPNDLVQNQYKHDVQGLSNRKSNVETMVPLDKTKRVNKRKLNEAVNGGQEANKRAAVQVDNKDVYQEPGPSNYKRVTKNQCEHIHQSQPSETAEVERKRKLPKKLVKAKNVGTENNEVNMTRLAVQKPDRRNKCSTEDQNKLVHRARPDKTDEVENRGKSKKVVGKGKNIVKEGEGGRKAMVQKPGSRNIEHSACVAHDQSRTGKKDNAQALSGTKGTNANLTDARAANIDHEKEDDDGSDDDVQIIDSADLVPSRRFERRDTESQDLRGPSRDADFRTRVLELLNKPYDSVEYKTLRDVIIAENYFDTYRDLQTILIKRQLYRGRCLAIVRGFFFWLENSKQEGAFKPWLDDQCLEVEAPGAPPPPPPKSVR